MHVLRTVSLLALLPTLACSDVYRGAEEAFAEGALVVTVADGTQTELLPERLSGENGAVACQTPSLVRGPLLSVQTGEGADAMRLVLANTGEGVDADEAEIPFEMGFTWQGHTYDVDPSYGCSASLAAYDESGHGTLVVDCGMVPYSDLDGREVHSGEAIVLQGAVDFGGCLRDRERIGNSEDFVDGVENVISASDSSLVRDLAFGSAAAVAVPVLLVAVVAAGGGGHGGFRL
ncbi:MAG: hypothetical protein AAF938_28020 [Myxococcota bacterium]